MPISIFTRPANESAPPDRHVEVSDFLKLLSGQNTNSIVRKSQEAVEQYRKTGRSEDKLKIPSATFGATVSGRGVGKVATLSGLVALDIDKLGGKDLGPTSEMLDTLSRVGEDKHTRAAYETPSGNGIRVLVEVEDLRHATEDLGGAYRDAWLAVSKYYLERYQVAADPAAKDVARLSFLYFGGATYVSGDSEPFPLPKKVVHEIVVKRTPKDAYQPLSEPDLREALKFLDSEDYGTWRDVAWGLRSAHYDFEVFRSWSASAPNFDLQACQKLWDNPDRTEGPTITFGTILHRAREAGYKAPTMNVGPETPKEGGLSVEEVLKYRTHPLQLSRNYTDLEFSEALNHSCVQLGYDVRRGGLSMRHGSLRSDGSVTYRPQDWKNYDDAARVALIFRLEKTACVPSAKDTAPWAPSRDRFRNLVLAEGMRNSFDPFLEWLRGLPQWDGKSRSPLFELFSCEDNALSRYAADYPAQVAIARAITPGRKADMITILTGPQNIGKSLYWACQLPGGSTSDYYVSTALDVRNQNRLVEASAGKVYVDLAELAGMRKADIDAMKALLSQQVHTYRKPYAEEPTSTPVRYSIVGTTNANEPLPNDHSGNRRFLVVPVDSQDSLDPADMVEYWDRNREQYWAEQLTKSNDFKLYLAEEVYDMQRVQNESLQYKPEGQRSVEEYLSHAAPPLVRLYELMSEVEADSKLPYKSLLERDAISALHVMGYRRSQKYIDGKSRKVWVADRV